MDKEIQSYLNEIHSHLHLDTSTEEKIIKEIYYHLEDALEESRNTGLYYKEPFKDITQTLGNPRDVARLLYEAHSRGSWEEVALHLQPYLLFIALFAFHLCYSFFPLLVSFIFTLAVLFLSIRRGMGNWIFSWGGFLFSSLVPLFILSREFLINVTKASILMLYGRVNISQWVNSLNQAVLPFHNFMYLTILFFILLLGGLLSIHSMYRTLKYDWLPVSSMLMLLPLLLGWSLILKRTMAQFGLLSSQVEQLDSIMIYSLSIYTLSSLIFIRAASRHIKITALGAGSVFGVIFLIKNTIGIEDMHTLLFLIASTLVFLFIPLLVYRVFFQAPDLDAEFLKSLSKRKEVIHHSMYQ